MRPPVLTQQQLQLLLQQSLLQPQLFPQQPLL